ncbi:MAG: copper chaperone PCu(A)C [Hyphomicrobiales bacterium]
MIKSLKICLAVIVGFLASQANAMEMEFKAGDLMLKAPWVRVTLPGRPGAAYVSVHNMGKEDDKIVAASSPAAEKVELHTHAMKDGVMKMRQVEFVEVPANAMIELKPGGHHLMIFGLKELPKPGEMVPLTLTFEKAGPVEIKAMVKSMKAGDHGNMDHGKKPDDTMSHGN